MSCSILKVLSVSLGMMMGLPTVVGAKRARRYTVGALSLRTAVLRSVAVKERTGASGLAMLAVAPRSLPLAMKRCQLKTRSSMAKGRPLTGGLLCQRAFGWILTVS